MSQFLPTQWFCDEYVLGEAITQRAKHIRKGSVTLPYSWIQQRFVGVYWGPTVCSTAFWSRGTSGEGGLYDLHPCGEYVLLGVEDSERINTWNSWDRLGRKPWGLWQGTEGEPQESLRGAQPCREPGIGCQGATVAVQSLWGGWRGRWGRRVCGRGEGTTQVRARKPWSVFVVGKGPHLTDVSRYYSGHLVKGEWLFTEARMEIGRSGGRFVSSLYGRW